MSVSVFHIGEQHVQARVGVRETVERRGGKIIRSYLPEQHRAFYSQLPFIVAAARDGQNRPWATLLAGPPGFITSPDQRRLEFTTRLFPGDALTQSLRAGVELGLLGIDLETRRRNRVNGTITQAGANTLRLEVGQTFGNCPQYITARSWYEVDTEAMEAEVSRHRRLDADMESWITSADTLFIASGYHGHGEGAGDRAAFGMDASHRGGTPGFVRIETDTRIVIPDYAGNNHFNTIGNLVMDPAVGVLFVDFDQGSLLQVTGRATIDFDSSKVAKHPGAQRLVVIDIAEIVRQDNVLSLRWSQPTDKVRDLRVVRKTRETDDVVSLELAAHDGGKLPDFEAGQHLPIEFCPEGRRGALMRTYSLSSGPGQHRYRISVKRVPQGLVSNLIHGAIEEGSIIRSRAPAGNFVFNGSMRPVVLVSAGIGVTPMVSMLHQLATYCHEKPVTFIHGTRDGAHHLFATEICELANRHPKVRVEVVYSRPRPGDVKGRDYHREGHINGAVIEELATNLDADFYLCGPSGFMTDITASLESLGIDPGRIHTETFGSSG